MVSNVPYTVKPGLYQCEGKAKNMVCSMLVYVRVCRLIQALTYTHILAHILDQCHTRACMERVHTSTHTHTVHAHTHTHTCTHRDTRVRATRKRAVHMHTRSHTLDSHVPPLIFLTYADHLGRPRLQALRLQVLVLVCSTLFLAMPTLSSQHARHLAHALSAFDAIWGFRMCSAAHAHLQALARTRTHTYIVTHVHALTSPHLSPTREQLRL